MKPFIILFLFSLASSSLYSQDIQATTSDGKAVLLKPNGTWVFANDSTSLIPKSTAVYSRSSAATNVFKTKSEKIVFYYGPDKWSQGNSDDPAKTTFNHKDGELFGSVIYERPQMSLDLLMQAAISNARKVSPSAEITSREYRVVNGKEMLCLQMSLKVQGTDFIFLGYYCSSAAGSIQVVTYTFANLFDNYQAEATAFMDGITISD